VREAAGAEAAGAIEREAREHGTPFVARVDRSTRAREGRPLELLVDTRRLHFFEPETGRGIYGDDTDEAGG
jgi:hypothetical protein